MKYLRFTLVYLFIMFLTMGIILSDNGIIRASDDDVPFFAGNNGLPNVLLIFDNSDSMQDLPYPRKDGSPVRPSGWEWRRGVVVDDDGTIAENDSGHIIYDYYKYVTTDEQLTLPGTTPPPIPGVGSLTSTITNVPGSDSNRIYDNNVDWSDSAVHDWSNFVHNYRYCLVKILDKNGAIQYRTITDRSTGGKYWRVNQNIHYDSSNEPYTYEIVSGQPGEVTYNYSNPSYVFDANFDWSTIPDWSTFSNTYRYKKLVVTAGTNAGESRGIYSYSSSSKYWRLASPFPEPCDHTTRYKIVGSADDNKRASGGNHPASKLYQAKKALNQLLDSSTIRYCAETDASGNCISYKYKVNFAFATYMSARIPRVRAKYYRKVTFDNPDRCRAYYWRMSNTSANFYDNDGPTNGYDITAWGTHYEDVSVGDHIDRLYREGHCDEQTIHYTITDISPSPTDSSPNRYRIHLESRVGVGGEGGYKYFHWLYFEVSDCSECGTYSYPDPYDDGSHTWHLVGAGDACYQDPGCAEGSTGWYYQTTYHDTYGDYNVTDPDEPRYIDRNTLMVTPEKGRCSIPGDDWLCTDPDPDAGEWTLVESTIENVPINSDGDLGDITPNTYDYSYFRYPGKGDADHPHGWSYKRAYYDGDTSKKWIYRRGYWTGEADWGDDIQPDPYFPADIGGENANHSGDDQIIFVNLPEYDDSDPYKGDDVNGNNISLIKNYISLARVTYPGDSRYVVTMMPYTDSLPVNSSQALSGKGTPLAATLQDAKRYFESYIAQDSYTLGGCRDNYIILLTDGLETCDGDPVQAAEDLRHIVVNDQEFDVKTFVIGFGLDDQSKANLNAIANAGGTDSAYFANNMDELLGAFNDIFPQIYAASYTRSSPVITTLTDPTDNLRIYTAYFDYPVWRGHLKAFEVDKSDGHIIGPVSTWPGDCDGDGNNDADAGCEMKLHGRGTVYTTTGTGISPGKIEFSTSNASTLKALINPEGYDIDGNGTADEIADAETIINYVLDPGYDNARYVGNRDKNWPMGDIYHSAPVVVTKPAFNLSDSNFPGYAGFKASHTARNTLIYVGANDGMVHGIRASNGQEEWAYIPKAVLSKLYEFRIGHRFTVDLPMRAADIYSSGGTGTPWSAVTHGNEEDGWHTVLVSGLRKGGYYYFAIDVTDDSNPVPMWEITDANMGQTWSTPSFGRINVNGVNKYVIFVGGGYSTTENKGNRIYIIDVATGSILKEFTVGDPTNNVPSELLVVRSDNTSSSVYGNIEAVYFGDTSGTLWKISDLNAESGWNPTLETLFVPANPRPIYHKPAISIRKRCGRRFILFGTGDEQHPTESDSYDYFYEVEDRPLQAGETNQDRLMWQESFPAGEKMLSDPTVYLGVVYFTTFQPQGSCGYGSSYLYGIKVSTCTTLGGDGGIRYGLDEEGNDIEYNPRQKKISLGAGIATSVVIGPPRAYLQKPTGTQQNLGPPMSFKVPTVSKLIYWKEEF